MFSKLKLVYDESYAYRTREDSIATEIWGNEILDDKYYTYYTDSILKILKKNDPYSPEGVRFNVENDSIATKFHKEQDAKTFIEKIALREILYMPEEHKQMRIVPTIAPHFPNALLETVRDAYHEHRPLALSPDVIWLTICQGMSFHIKKFWMNIYKDKTEYGTFAITGWIHKLFPYLVSGEKNPFLNKKVTVSDDLVSNKFPGSTVKVPFTWHNVFENRTDSLYFWSGIWGAKQYGDKTLEPFISWALTKQELIK